MSTEETAGTSAETAGEHGGSAEPEPQERALVAEDANGVAASEPPDDPQELRQEIERTREQLGETVEALAAKADVKAQAQDKARQLTGRLKSKAAQARAQAAGKASQVQRQLGGKTAGPRQQAAAGVGRIAAVTPEPVRRAAGKAAATARQRRVPLAAAVGAALLACLMIARWRRR